MRSILLTMTAAIAIAIPACGGAGAHFGSNSDDVVEDTSNPAARAQYDANVAFANAYVPQCAPSPPPADGTPARPRVLVTGFGRFMTTTNNATGRIVSELVPSVPYPETTPPAAGQVDPPAPQLSVGVGTVTLPNAGDVDVCAMIVPVYWDLASVLIAKEIDSFAPSFVLLNGVADARQPIWIELGSVNRAAPLDDGSGQLLPISDPSGFAPIVPEASSDDTSRGLLLSWTDVQSAAASAIAAHADDVENDVRFGDILSGVAFAGYPRSSNTYLCNDVTYVTDYLMAHPSTSVSLMTASTSVDGVPNSVPVQLAGDFRAVPRVFVHWPGDLDAVHHAAAADVMRAIVDAQLTAMANGDAPTIGDNALADPTLVGGATF